MSLKYLSLLLLLLPSLAAAEPVPKVVYLWPSGATTLQGANEKEITNPPDAQPGQRVRQIRNIHNPSIEIFLPSSENANGSALIVAPGGGHRELVIGTEGYDLTDWLNGMGVAV